MLRIDDIRSGNHLAGARMIRLIEDKDPKAVDLLKSLYPHSGNAFIIGITGSPGTGKSTLIDALIFEFRKRDFTVAVIAVDPTSPFTGGAILGDRLRMQRHAADDKVFIRSMASRGRQGGLSRATKDAVIVLDTMGFEIIIIETVGAGQTEFDVAGLAHSVGIVTIPGSGDGIQAIKAGILETGDLFIVNKCDRPGSNAAFNQLETMTRMKQMKPSDAAAWTARVLKTTAIDGTGVKDVADTFLSHLTFMKKNAVFDQKKKIQDRLYFKTILEDLAMEKITRFMNRSKTVEKAISAIESGRMDPISAAQTLVDELYAIQPK